MAVERRRRDLSPRSRRLVVAGAVIEGTLKIAALADIKRRPAGRIRGAKWAWATGVALVNGFGAAPLAYFAFGRRGWTGPTVEPSAAGEGRQPVADVGGLDRPR
jgi:hypothetical protein